MRSPGLAPGLALIAHSGGPTAVINASLVGAIEQAAKHSLRICGARFGVSGILQEDFVDLSGQSAATLRAVAKSPGSALGSSRQPLASSDLERIVDIFRARDIRIFFYTGGNGSMMTASEIAKCARESGYELQVIGIPKTIDNDLQGTDHTPGYASAAKFFATAVRDVGADNKALPGQVEIIEVLGRNTGWIAAATGLARLRETDAPHLIYLPEEKLPLKRFLDDVERTFTRFGHCVAVVCEGQLDDCGEPFGADVRSGSRGSLALNLGHRLASLVNRDLKLRARSEKPGLLGRCASTSIAPHDSDESYMCGVAAVNAAIAGYSGKMVTLLRSPGSRYECLTRLIDLDEVAHGERLFPVEWRQPADAGISQAFRAWIEPLTGNVPAHGELESL
jgi:6-phosphofructokinase